MTLNEFIEEKDVTCTTRLVDVGVLKEAENLIGVPFGEQLKKYLLEYGYLCYKFSELYGMNSNEMLDSDMVKQTIYIHKYFPETKSLVAIENQGEGDYYLVDSKDCVYEYDSDLKELTETNMTLFEYILNRFEEIDMI